MGIQYAYVGDIVKTEKDPDTGDLIVYGKATGPDLDLDEQICDPDWLKSAMPEWFEWGNVREMHQPIAAGVGSVLEAQGDDWWVKSTCVDANTADKIEKKVLKGYSIGIKDPKVIKDDAAPGGRIVGGVICEISYVDRPCNPTATLAIAKAVGASTTLQPVEAEDAAGLELSIHVGGHSFTPADLAKMLAKKSADVASEPVAVEPEQEEPAVEETPEPVVDENAVAEAPEIVLTVNGEAVSEADLAGAISAFLKDSALVDAAVKNAATEVPKPQYPVESLGSLRKAIQDGADTDAAKSWALITAGAERLGRDDLQATVADLAKAVGTGEAGQQIHNPAEIAAIRDGLVALINAELAELCNNEPELYDIEQLLCSLRALMRWWENEGWNGETTGPYEKTADTPEVVTDDAVEEDVTEEIEMGAKPDSTKTEVPAEDTTKTTGPDATKADGPVDENRLTELVKSATAAVEKAFEERFAALEATNKTLTADLERALALPEPGGPVLTRTAAQAAIARVTDAVQLQTEATELLNKAAAASDPYLAKGYRDRAAELTAKATA